MCASALKQSDVGNNWAPSSPSLSVMMSCLIGLKARVGPPIDDLVPQLVAMSRCSGLKLSLYLKKWHEEQTERQQEVWD